MWSFFKSVNSLSSLLRRLSLLCRKNLKRFVLSLSPIFSRYFVTESGFPFSHEVIIVTTSNYKCFIEVSNSSTSLTTDHQQGVNTVDIPRTKYHTGKALVHVPQVLESCTIFIPQQQKHLCLLGSPLVEGRLAEFLQ